MENQSTEKPFLVTKKRITITTRRFNPNYGNDRTCKCGHPYHRHFDLYGTEPEEEDVGCKYCREEGKSYGDGKCAGFKENLS